MNPFPTPTSSAPPTVQPTTSVDYEDVSMGGTQDSLGEKRKTDLPAEEFHDQTRDHKSRSQGSHVKRLKSGEVETPKASGPVPTIEEILAQSNVGPLYLTSSKRLLPFSCFALPDLPFPSLHANVEVVGTG